MTLSKFMFENIDQILSEWDTVARSLDPTVKGMSDAALRDDARQIIKSLAKDVALRTSAATSPALRDADDNSAAATHGTLRQTSGFSLAQVKTEYRALRLSIVEMWLPGCGLAPDEAALSVAHFDATIAQAQAESVAAYVRQAERTQTAFLGSRTAQGI